MASLDTLEEIELRAAPQGSVRLLTFVLHYDDLLSDRSEVIRLDPFARWTLGRSEVEPSDLKASAGSIRLPDRRASSSHARIERRGQTDFVIDLGSRNGTWVNGERVEERSLADGDLIEIGRSLFCYRLTDPRASDALLRDGKPVFLGPTQTFCPEVAVLAGSLSRIAPTAEPILILGETGTGKEVVARHIHQLSGRSGELRPIDCGAIPDSLVESTFFGHTRGAFTGANEARVGEIPRAHGGTLFLDEVANMSANAQTRLLRVLDDGFVVPLGGTASQRVDIRIVAATNRDLVGDPGAFRQDLLRRIAGYVARLLPLRNRREDLGALTAHLLRDAGVRSASIQPRAARTLFCSKLEGNVRQLRTTLRSAVALAGGEPIAPDHLPPLFSGMGNDEVMTRAAGQPSTRSSNPPARRAPDRDEIARVLQQTRGNMVQAARLLNVHARQLYRWVDKHGIDVERLRD